MPIFDVITINQDHVSRVLVAKQTHFPDTTDRCNIMDFLKWKQYIRQELKKSNLLSTSIQRQIQNKTLPQQNFLSW
jgi:hypothetical protein